MRLALCILLVVGVVLGSGVVPALAQPVWPDRRPIARWFIAEHTQVSVSNPRGYLSNASLNAFDAPAFHTAVMNQATGVIARLNAMHPRPQGVIIWDLEGQEFPHVMTYVGHPASLAVLAPEMEAVADEVFSTLRSAGYRVGITVRPQVFTWGNTLPETCATGPTYEYWDVRVKLNASANPPTARLYACATAPNTWSVSSSGYQQVLDDDATIYTTLRDKIQYAITRWGASIFYLDSTLYKDGNGTISATPFQQLMTLFPQVLLIPEWLVTGTWGVTAGYAAHVYQPKPPTAALALYPGTFAAGPTGLAADGSDSADVQATMRARVRAGGVLMVDAWWDNPQDQYVLQAYQRVAAERAFLPFFVAQ